MAAGVRYIAKLQVLVPTSLMLPCASILAFLGFAITVVVIALVAKIPGVTAGVDNVFVLSVRVWAVVVLQSSVVACKEGREG